MFDPHELEPPGEPPELGGSFQPDPVADLIESATDWTYLTTAGILAGAVLVAYLLIRLLS